MESKQINIENVAYTMTPANAMTAWTALKNAMKLYCNQSIYHH